MMDAAQLVVDIALVVVLIYVGRESRSDRTRPARSLRGFRGVNVVQEGPIDEGVELPEPGGPPPHGVLRVEDIHSELAREPLLGKCLVGRHVVQDGRMTCDCSAVSLMRQDEDVIVMVYNERR